MRGKDRQSERPLCYCSVCGGEVYEGERWEEQEGAAVCMSCTEEEQMDTKAMEEWT